MPTNTLLTATHIAPLAVELLRRQLVLPATTSTVAGADYSGTGGTVTIRVPRPRIARQQVTPGATITFDDVEEIGVALEVSHLYNAALVTDEDLSLSLVDFGTQVLRPQVAAVADGAEDQMAAAMNGLDVDATIEFSATANPDNTVLTLLEIREELTRRKVPAGDRFLAVAPDVATRILAVPQFVRVDERGTATALEDAVLGRLYGLTIIESPAITAGSAVAYHRSAFAWANFPPSATNAMNATVVREEGVALRYAQPFLADRLTSASIVSTFAGATVVEDAPDTVKRAVRVATATP